MGCWNGTCFLSHLPIHAGEEIKIIFLEKTNEEAFTNNTGVCYSNTFFKPIYFPISGRYDDYGGIEDVKMDYITTQGLDIFKKYIGGEKSDLIYIDSREKAEWSWENIWRSIERNIGTFYLEDEDDDVNFGENIIGIMIRQDVWDRVVNIQLETKNDWDDERIIDILDRKWKLISESSESDSENEFIREWKKYDKYDKFFDIFTQKMLFRSFFNLFDKSKLRDDKLSNILDGKEVNDLELFKKYVFEISAININLGMTRRIWGHGGSGAGSQSDNWKLYQKIYQAYQEISDEKIKEWDEEYES
jgi:hypothetical protein